ncbi:MAG: thioesterase [Gracilimonas sp.]|uniref:acyl-[acyl-carrier-protein] thioesterase n=1 Tax=Gracilimonas sp. TaxID=1974203 RepID=UPI00374FDF52|nr:thioesterase [Gracilimonas sp.]
MAEDITKYSESFKIRASEVDQNGKATLPAICSLFQEVAGNHALKLSFDITQLHKQNLTWVLHRMDIKIHRFPEWRETVTIETWPAAGDALRAYRDYRILDAEGNEIGCCLSYWMMINIKTRRPTRMPGEVLELRLSEIDHVLPVKSSRMKPFPDEAKVAKTHLKVRRSDLDMNDHVNNARYVEWMLETFEDEKIKIHQIDIMFLQESRAGDDITSERIDLPDTYQHQLKNQDDKILALAECR